MGSAFFLLLFIEIKFRKRMHDKTKKRIWILIWGLLLSWNVMTLYAHEELGREVTNKRVVPSSLLEGIFEHAPHYARLIDSYKAELYLKGKLTVHKKNMLLRYIPSMFDLEKEVREYMQESISELHYKAPDIYERKMKALTGTFKGNGGEITDVFDFLRVNPYSSVLMYDKLLSPLDRESKKYYTYLQDSVVHTPQGSKYKIKIVPNFKSTQLVSGYMWVSEDSFILEELFIKGDYDLISFEVYTRMGKTEDEKLLPVYFLIGFDFKLVGNHLSMDYEAWVDYQETKFYEEAYAKTLTYKKISRDLTKHYTLSCDTSSLITDPLLFDSIRPRPLKPSEYAIYTDMRERRDSTAIAVEVSEKKQKIKERLVFWGKVGDALISDYNIDIDKIGSVRMSPLINPLLLQYSPRNGISYQQRFYYNNLFNDGELIRVAPSVGYNFTKNELYVNADAEWHYWPEKMARFNLSAGNGNRIYSSVVLDQLKAFPDSIFSFENLDLEYFKDVYINASHTIEPMNGLKIDVGVSMHWRSLINEPKLDLLPPAQVYSSSIEKRIRTHYNSFAPRLRVEFTPGMYYFMNGRRKVNVGSTYPTLMVDYERGLHNILGSNGGHERIEIEMQQKIKLGGMRSVGYRIGGGLFTNQEEMYFVDFANFVHSNLPGGWNDEVNGVFQLLDGRYYNSSREYWRINSTYESPFIFLKPLNKWLGKVQQERIYAGLLFMTHLKPYIELGYGVGTHIFDAGVFVSSVNGGFGTVGCTFRFELFNK